MPEITINKNRQPFAEKTKSGLPGRWITFILGRMPSFAIAERKANSGLGAVDFTALIIAEISALVRLCFATLCTLTDHGDFSKPWSICNFAKADDAASNGADIVLFRD